MTGKASDPENLASISPGKERKKLARGDIDLLKDTAGTTEREGKGLTLGLQLVSRCVNLPWQGQE